jgi:hypothetical protein
VFSSAHGKLASLEAASISARNRPIRRSPFCDLAEFNLDRTLMRRAQLLTEQGVGYRLKSE